MDEQAGPGVFFNNNNNSGLPGAGKGPQQPGDVGGGEAARAHYNIPGILHFLQHEWARFEVDRAQWEVERAELQAQIAFLQGERKGQENLKKDLVRRIKMLEYALKQERSKYHKLKYGTELNQGDMKPPSYDDSGKFPSGAAAIVPVTFNRALLSRYLQEVGYTDTILDVKSQRVRALLGLAGDSGERPSVRKPEPMVNGTEPSFQKDNLQFNTQFIQSLRPPLCLFNPLCLPQMVRKKTSSSPSSSSDMSDDPDTEEALKGFDFLASPDEMEGSPDVRSVEDSGDWGEGGREGGAWSDNQEGTTWLEQREEFVIWGTSVCKSPTDINTLCHFTQVTNSQDALRKTWNPKFTLRSHFDSIRGLAFHPVEPVLVTASEDHTLKLWNLQKTAPAKKCAALDVEPIYTFRAHRGAVLCVTMSSTGEQCFSGGVDGTIQSWNTPNPNIDPYDSYEPSVLRGALLGHTDSVWGVVYSSAHQRLLSCSGDGTVRLWNAANTSPALAIFNEKGELGVPTSVDLVCSESAHMVTSFSTGEIGLFNMETRQLILKLDQTGEPEAPCKINKVLSHPTLPITITAQEDRHIQFFDNNTGKCIHSMVAHLDAVTSLAVDPNGLYLMSGSHDCSIRLWNMESKTCIQEFTAHRKKSDEAIHDVAFHPTKCYIGSAGADALAKVFV
uniref:Striatin n=1 Tax=Oncorhynchus mykiss TaxID=8022 RepID=A0A8C7UBS8_ONCMY